MFSLCSVYVQYKIFAKLTFYLSHALCRAAAAGEHSLTPRSGGGAVCAAHATNVSRSCLRAVVRSRARDQSDETQGERRAQTMANAGVVKCYGCVDGYG